jgi:hypothetical protein
VTVVCPAVPGLASRQTVEGIEVVRARYAPRRFETLAATGSMYREARGIRSVSCSPDGRQFGCVCGFGSLVKIVRLLVHGPLGGCREVLSQ